MGFTKVVLPEIQCNTVHSNTMQEVTLGESKELTISHKNSGPVISRGSLPKGNCLSAKNSPRSIEGKKSCFHMRQSYVEPYRRLLDSTDSLFCLMHKWKMQGDAVPGSNRL